MLNSILTTLLLCGLTSLVSISIGTFTALAAWWSNRSWAYYFPLLTLAIPPWLLAYNLSYHFGYIDPMLGAVLALGLCCSVYPHSIISASLANRAHKSWEMMVVTNGANLKSLYTAVYPSLKVSLLPSLAIVAAECIADFGVMNFYGINTVTMLTYNIWTSTWNLTQLFSGLIVLALAGIIISRLDVDSVSSITSDQTNKKKTGWAYVAVTPTLVLLSFSIFTSIMWMLTGATLYTEGFVAELMNTLQLTLWVVVVCCFTTLLYLSNYYKEFMERTGLGLYALPGTVIGAAVLYVFGNTISLMALLVFAIFLRYYGLMINTVAAAGKGNQKYFEVIDFYQPNKFKAVIMKAWTVLPAIFMGVCLIVLDVIRELPISMILQPMNFQTLAMRMNYIARNEAIPMLGPHSFVILSIGLLCCAIIIRSIYATTKKLRV